VQELPVAYILSLVLTFFNILYVCVFLVIFCFFFMVNSVFFLHNRVATLVLVMTALSKTFQFAEEMRPCFTLYSATIEIASSYWLCYHNIVSQLLPSNFWTERRCHSTICLIVWTLSCTQHRNMFGLHYFYRICGPYLTKCAKTHRLHQWRSKGGRRGRNFVDQEIILERNLKVVTLLYYFYINF